MKVLRITILLLVIVIIGIAGLYFTDQFHCRKMGILPRDTTGVVGGQPETQNEYMTLLSTKTCLVRILGEDGYFNGNSMLMEIGFFDQFGFLHKYPARIGGEDSSGNIKQPTICTGDSKSQRCRPADLSELRSLLKPEEVINSEIIIKDSAPWKAAEDNKKFSGFFNSLHTALKGKGRFPSPPNSESFGLQIWQVGL